jgi:hypothetical protein
MRHTLRSIVPVLFVVLLMAGCSSSRSSSGSGVRGGAAASGPLNWQATPFFGTLNLAGGFTPDPTTVSVRAGGPTRNPVSGSGCTGFLTTSAPDVDVNYSGSGNLALTLSAASDTDISMVVYTADGRWLCDDDSGEGLNPRITIQRPARGNYNVWIATYRATSDRPRATVGVSEIGREATY